MGGACGGLGRALTFRAVPGQWPVNRGELTPSTDPAGFRAKHQLTTAHRQTQKDLRGHPAPPTRHRWFQRGLRRKYRGRGPSSFLLLYSPALSDRAGQALGAGAGPRAGSPEFGQGSHRARGS